MGNDRVLSVYDGGVIAAFVEHTHIDAKDVGEIYSTDMAPSSGLMIIR